MAQQFAPTAQPAPQTSPTPAPAAKPGGGRDAVVDELIMSGLSGYQQQSAAVRPGAYGASPLTPPRRAIGKYQEETDRGDKAREIRDLTPQVEAAKAAVAAAEEAIASTPLLDAAKEFVVDQALDRMGEVGDVIKKLQDAKEFVDNVATLLDSEAGAEAQGEAVKGLVMQVMGEIPVISTILGALDKTLQLANDVEKKAQAEQQVEALRAHAATVTGQLHQLEMELARLEGRSTRHVVA